MDRGFPMLKLAGSALFVLGSIILSFSIVGLVPGDQPVEVGTTMLTYMIIDVLMLFVATFMVSVGMFFYIYSGSWRSSIEARRRRS